MAKLEEMQGFSSRGARRARGMRVSSSLAEINVVPLVDVMLVLLVIFMVAAPLMQQGFAVQLPQEKKAAPIDTTPIMVVVPLTFHSDRRVKIGQDTIPLDVLPERVRQALGGQLKRGVTLAGDGGVTLQDLTTVFAALQAGGVDRIGIMTQPPNPSGG
ncbi:MAG TPA: biopolymer transporter ExbD [Vicinamibacterales bacterium]